MPSLRGVTRRSNLSERSPRSPDVWRPRDDGRARCALICVGSELLRGKINMHSSTLARRLASIGLELNEEHTVADDVGAIARVIRRALGESQIVIVTGGLGPTFDDLTREAASAATGRPLRFSSSLLRKIKAKFRWARYRTMPPANKRQAYLLAGAKPLSNSVGTAPGQWLELRAPSNEQRVPRRSLHRDSLLSARYSLLILLPGPPTELTPMLEDYVLPELRRTYSVTPRAEAHLHFVGLPESVVDHKVRPLIQRWAGAEFTILAKLGLVDLDIFVSDKTQARAAKRLAKIVHAVRVKIGKAFYGMNEDYPLEKVVMNQFLSHKATLAVAESCTGGMLAQQLTDVAGSSKYFLGGVVSYANTVKLSELAVPRQILRRHGAVSEQTAAAMAKGVRQKLGSTWGVGITGIAGPGGGTVTKPVGLVYIGLAGPKTTRTIELHLRGSRDAIRTRSVLYALDLLRLIYL
jgi:nicotinamide-nucleotide amidase